MLKEIRSDVDSHQHFISKKKIKLLIVTLIISFIGYFLFILLGGFDNVISSLERVGLKGVFVALCLSSVNILLRFARWQYFLSVLGFHVPLKNSFRIYLAGFSLTTTPGKTGEILRSVFLKDYHVPFRKCVGAFLSERISDLLSVSLLAGIGVSVYKDVRVVLFSVLVVIFIIFMLIRNDSSLFWLSKNIKRLLFKRYAGGVEFIIESLVSFKSCFTGKVILTGVSFGVLAWGTESIALMYILHLLGYDIGLLTTAFIYGFSLVVGGITLMPGGLGGVEITMMELLVINAVPSSVAVAATLVIRLTSLWFSVFIGIIALPKKQIFWKLKKND